MNLPFHGIGYCDSLAFYHFRHPSLQPLLDRVKRQFFDYQELGEEIVDIGIVAPGEPLNETLFFKFTMIKNDLY